MVAAYTGYVVTDHEGNKDVEKYYGYNTVNIFQTLYMYLQVH